MGAKFPAPYHDGAPNHTFKISELTRAIASQLVQ